VTEAVTVATAEIVQLLTVLTHKLKQVQAAVQADIQARVAAAPVLVMD
jgi:hypothetical protein